VEGDITLDDLIRAGYELSKLVEAGYTVRQLWRAGYEISELKEAGFTLTQMISEDQCGIKVEEVAGGLVGLTQELWHGGFTALELRVEYWSPKTLLDAADGAAVLENEVLAAGEELRDLWRAGKWTFGRSDGASAELAESMMMDGWEPWVLWGGGLGLQGYLKALGITALAIRESLGAYSDPSLTLPYSEEEIMTLALSLEQVGYTAGDLREAHFTAMEVHQLFELSVLKDVGYTALDLALYFSLQELVDVKYTAADLYNAGYSAAQLKPYFKITELMDAGYSALQMVAAPFTIDRLRAIGYSAEEFKNAGYSASDLRDANYSATELYNVGYVLDQLRDAGYPLREYFGLGLGVPYNINNLLNANYTIEEIRLEAQLLDLTTEEALFNANVDAGDMRDGGYTATRLKEAGYSAEDMKAGGYSAREMRLACFPATYLQELGYTLEEIKEAGYTATELKDDGFTAKTLVDFGFGIEELLAAQFSFEAMKDADFSAGELREAGATRFFDTYHNEWSLNDPEGIKKLKAAGYDAHDIRDAGYPLLETMMAYTIGDMVEAGVIGSAHDQWSLDNILHPDMSSGGALVVTVTDLYAGGVTAEMIHEYIRKPGDFSWGRGLIEGRDYREAGYTAKQFKEAEDNWRASGQTREYITAERLKQAGYTATQLSDAQYTAVDLKPLYSLDDLYNAGYTATQLKSLYSLEELIKVGFTFTQLQEAGFTTSQFADTLQSLYTDQFFAGVLKTRGFTATQLKQAGYSARQLQEVGFTATQLKVAGFLLVELSHVFTATQLKVAVYPLADLVSVGFTPIELRTADYSATELKNHFDLATLVKTGFTVRELKAAQYTISDLLDHFVLNDIIDGGYTTQELTDAGIAEGYQILTLIPLSKAGMVVEACFTQEVTAESDYGAQASKITLDISPADFALTEGGQYTVEFDDITAIDTNTYLNDRRAQKVRFDLSPYVKEIFGEEAVQTGHYPAVAVRVEAYDEQSNMLAYTTLLRPEHNLNQITNPAELVYYDRPTTPVITEISHGDNEISGTFTTTSVDDLLTTENGVVAVDVVIQADITGAPIRSFKVAATSHATNPISGERTIGFKLDGRIGDDNTEYKLVNNVLHEVSVGVANEHGASLQSDTRRITPSNLPAQLTNPNVITDLSRYWDPDNGVPIDGKEVLTLSDSGSTNGAGWFGCILEVEFSDLDAYRPGTCRFLWGVVPTTSDQEGAYGFAGMDNNRRASLPISTAMLINGKYRLMIPPHWFKDDEGNTLMSIKLQARVGQTTTDTATDVTKEYFGALMENAQTAYLVTSEQVAFNQEGPLNNGIKVIERNSNTGSQRFSVAGKTFDPSDMPTVTYSYPGSTPLTGNISIDSSGGDFTGNMAALTYNQILNGDWGLTFRATVIDPNGTPAAGGNVQKFVAESTVTLYPFKDPTGVISANIERTTVNTYPLCSCDISDLSANLNGWSLDSMQMKVFESDNSSNIVVSHQDLSLTSLNGSFDANTGLSYNNWPGKYDCRYTANLSLANMAQASKTLYGGFMDEPVIANTAVATENNYYNDPVITSARLDASGGRVGMRIQGSTGQYGLSVATAPGVVDTSDNWIFNTVIMHQESLVQDPDTDGFRVTADSGQIFDGFAVVDPTDAQSYFKLALE
jgi:biotin operon repressor